MDKYSKMIKVNSREEYLLELKKLLPENCYAVEIGVLYGDFSKQILEILKPAKLFLIDPYTKNEIMYKGLGNLSTAYSTEEDYYNVLERFKDEITYEKVVVDRNYSYNSVASFPDNSIHFLYLDGSHLFEDTKRDLNEWLPKMKQDSIISGHDYINIGNFGVIKAVDEFLNEHGFEIIIYNQNGGDWALKKVA